MRQGSINYADKQIDKIVSSPKLFALVVLFSVCAVAGFIIRLEFGVEWASTVGLILCFGGSSLLVSYLHNKSGSPTEEEEEEEEQLENLQRK